MSSLIKWRESADIFLLSIILAILYLKVIRDFLAGHIGINNVYFGILIILIIVFLWFRHREKYTRALLTLLLFFVVLYTTSYDFANIPLNYITSGIYIEKISAIDASSLESHLFFGEEEIVLRQYFSFSIGLPNKTNSKISIYLPKNTTRYNILITRNTEEIFSKVNQRVGNNPFPEQETVDISIERGIYHVEVILVLPEMKPRVSLSLNIHGHDKPDFKITNVYADFAFNEILYDCPEPCVLVRSENLYSFPPVKETTMLRHGGDIVKLPLAFYAVKGENVKEVFVLLRGMDRIRGEFLRDFSFAGIIGVIIMILDLNLRRKK